MLDIHKIYRPFLRHFRRRRLGKLYQTLGLGRHTRVIDVGGNAFIWKLAEEEGLPLPRLTIVNIYGESRQDSGFDWVVGDGRRLPFADKSFDVAFCNSVIEHLGTWPSQQRLAAEIDRVARSFFVQTPNRWYPFEPHLLTPLVHWLPAAVRRRMLRNFTVWGLIVRPSAARCDRLWRELRLLSPGEMRLLFPGARLVCERFLGLVKSIILVRGPLPVARCVVEPRFGRRGEVPLRVRR